MKKINPSIQSAKYSIVIERLGYDGQFKISYSYNKSHHFYIKNNFASRTAFKNKDFDFFLNIHENRIVKKTRDNEKEYFNHLKYLVHNLPEESQNFLKDTLFKNI